MRQATTPLDDAPSGGGGWAAYSRKSGPRRIPCLQHCMHHPPHTPHGIITAPRSAGAHGAPPLQHRAAATAVLPAAGAGAPLHTQCPLLRQDVVSCLCPPCRGRINHCPSSGSTPPAPPSSHPPVWAPCRRGHARPGLAHTAATSVTHCHILQLAAGSEQVYGAVGQQLRVVRCRREEWDRSSLCPHCCCTTRAGCC